MVNNEQQNKQHEMRKDESISKDKITSKRKQSNKTKKKKDNFQRDKILFQSKGRSYPNNPLFYAKDAAALENMASFNWSSRLGAVTLLNGYKLHVPGVMKLNFQPTLGSFIEKSDNELTLAADSFFNYLTQGYTGSVPFEAPDLLMHVLAASNVHLFIMMGKRAYGLMKYANAFNAYLPKTLVEASGFSYDSLNANLADFRAQLNIRINQVNKWFAVPTGLKICDRWEYLVSNVMTDSENFDKAQYYIYTPAKLLQVSATECATGTSLVEFNFINQRMSVQQYFTYLDTLIQSLQSQDTNNIFGALKRVYGEGQLKVASELTEDFVTPIIHEDIILESIHNTSVANIGYVIPNDVLTTPLTGITGDTLTNVVAYQQEGFIYTKPIDMGLSSGRSTLYSLQSVPNVFLDLLVGGYPGAATFVDATANTVVGYSELSYQTRITNNVVTKQTQYIGCRADVVTSITIFFDSAPDTHSQTGESAIQQVFHLAEISDSFERFLNFIGYSHSFNYAPLLFAENDEHFIPCSELTNYGLIDLIQIRDLHRRSFFQLLDMPANTKSITR